MSDLKVHDIQGKVVGSLKASEGLGGKVNTDILWQAVRMYQANQRQGNASVKTRAQVSGGGRKPWRQKGTGRSRHGSTRSPIWRKGGVAWGPHPKEFRYQLPQQFRRRALVESLRDKVGAGAVTVVQNLDGMEPKTKSFAGLLESLKVETSVLVVLPKPSHELARITRNIPGVVVRPVSSLNCLEVLESKRLLVTSEAFKQLEGICAS